ncbi:MAG: hypothetical protein OEQ18_02400 [Gammaproteobacteria bacterium]|nr:hypothetical protein [Gammaproteobacteria bacterium]
MLFAPANPPHFHPDQERKSNKFCKPFANRAYFSEKNKKKIPDLIKAPGTRRVQTLRRIDMITFKGMMPSMGGITPGGTTGDKLGSNNPLDAVKGLFGR